MLELFTAALEEIVIAFGGGDWGFGALGELIGDSELARSIVNGVASLGSS